MKNIKKILCFLLFGLMVPLTGCFSSNREPEINPRSLKTPTNLSFNDEDYVLTWSIVEHADQYKININGKDVGTVSENEYAYTPTTETTTFKVQASDSTYEYLTSLWSDELTYTLPAEEERVTEAAVNNFVNNLDKYAELKDVVGMYLKDGNMYVQAVYRDGRETVLKTFCIEYPMPVSSLKEAITNEYDRAHDFDEYTVSNYKSLESLLESDSFAGQMEELNQAGYEFSIVKSQTVENSDASDVNKNCSIFAVIRAERSGDVKYFQTRINCKVTNPSTHQEINYTTKLKNPSDRTVTEKLFNELTGDFYDFFDAIYQKNSK